MLSYISQQFCAIFLIVGFAVKLSMGRQDKSSDLRYFWLTIVSVAILIVANSLEIMAAKEPALHFWRILFSVIGYTFRPVAALSLVLVVARRDRKNALLWIPAILNFLIMCTAFFSPLAFSYDAEYDFHRGPLGYSVFVVGFLYLLLIFVFTYRRFRQGHPWERWILYLCGLMTVAGTLLDVSYGGELLNASIMISVVFFYMFLQTQDRHRDGMTRLLNRQAFYEDYEYYQPQVAAVASLDMNGLKILNDTQGHDAGDQAIMAIGKCLADVSSRTVVPFRMGGDEFLILFLEKDPEQVRRTVDAVVSGSKAAGYSLAAGCAFREGSESIHDLYLASDQAMYEDKTEYYRSPEHNRRRREHD